MPKGCQCQVTLSFLVVEMIPSPSLSLSLEWGIPKFSRHFIYISKSTPFLSSPHLSSIYKNIIWYLIFIWRFHRKRRQERETLERERGREPQPSSSEFGLVVLRSTFDFLSRLRLCNQKVL